MVSPAIFCARTAPSARMASIDERIGNEPLHLRADRAELCHRKIDQGRLEGGELRIAELRQHGRPRCVGECGVDADQVVGLRAVVETLLFAGQRLRVGLGAADFLRNRIGIVGEIDARLSRTGPTSTFSSIPSRSDMTRVASPVITGSGSGKKVSPKPSGMNRAGEVVVEFLRDVARQFEVLFLVLADRHMGGAIDQNVGRHQRRIGIEADGGVLAIFAGFLLELRHAVEPAEPGHAIEHPGEFGMLGHLALIEHDVLLGIDPTRDERSGHFADRARQFGGVLPRTVMACRSTTQ